MGLRSDILVSKSPPAKVKPEQLTIGKIHNNAQLALLVLVDLPEPDDSGVVKQLKHLDLSVRRFAFIFRHPGQVNLLDYGKAPITFCLHKVGYTLGTLAKSLDFLVVLRLFSRMRVFVRRISAMRSN